MSTSPRPATNGHSRRGRVDGHDSAPPAPPIAALPGSVVETSVDAGRQELQEKLERLTAAVAAAAAGDLTQEIPFRGDPSVGRLADALARLLSELRQSVAGTADNAQTLANSSEGP